jgi:hypothetical protein
MRRQASTWLLVSSALMWAAPAHADSNYPDPRQILLPPENPEQIILATNFGLILSDDGGASWLFSCEQARSAYAGPYLLGAGKQSRLFAVTSGAGLIYSDDASCSWHVSGGSLTDVIPYAMAIDPTDAQRVYAIGVPRQDLRGSESLYASNDGGLTFGEPLFTAEPHSALLTVMVAPSEPSTLFATLFTSPEHHPLLLRSRNWGRAWEVVADLSDSLGNSPVELLAIDAQSERRLHVRVLGPSYEALATSDDGGVSFVEAVSIPGKLNAFLELESGTILVGGVAGTEPIGYRSLDGGRSYQRWPAAPGVHALAERNGKLYIAANNYADGYAIAESDDEGEHLRPLAGFADVRGVRSCARDSCAKSCKYYADIELWPRAVCGPESEPPGPSEPSAQGPCAEASAPGDQGVAGKAADGSTGDARWDESRAAPERPVLRASGGCACSIFARQPSQGWFGFVLAAPLLRGLRRRRARAH